MTVRATPRAAPVGSAAALPWWRVLFGAMVRLLADRNLLSDRFGTLAAILGVALGTATVNVVLVLDASTVRAEAGAWATNPDLDVAANTVAITGFDRAGRQIAAYDAKADTHEDYQVMRSAIRLGSLSAFLVGALIVFFTFAVVVERRKREVALLRSLGALRGDVAAIFVREALIIGLLGAAAGFLVAFPMAAVAARIGISTTGRTRLAVHALVFPLRRMVLVSAVGAGTALLGVARPARDLLRLDVAATLRPRFVQHAEAAQRRRARGVTLIALPFMSLVYLLMRPFFRNALPSLGFFVFEAGLVCVGFLLTLLLVPELVQQVGARLVRLLPSGPAAARLLTERRIEHLGHELAWSVSGVMLVFSLLLSLHVATHALQREVVRWGSSAVEPYAYVYSNGASVVSPVTSRLPAHIAQVHFTGRTPWPNAVRAAGAAELVRFAEASGRPELVAMAGRLGPGKVIVSRMMARRFHVGEGDSLELGGRGGTRRLEVVAVTDDLGYVPVQDTYRNSKTYALIDARDGGLIAPYAAPMGNAIALAETRAGEEAGNGGPGKPAIPDWKALLAGVVETSTVRVKTGAAFEVERLAGHDSDFLIFDLILGLTSALAAIGIGNQMVLSIHTRRRELSLYRVLGMTAPQVRRMILFEGGFIGLLGGGLAVLLGVPLGYAAVGALRVVSAFEIDYELPPSYAVLTLAGAVGVALLASLYPASRAAGAGAAESIHYE